MTRTPLVAGNWKMNGCLAENKNLLTELNQGLGQDVLAKVQVAVFPPSVYLTSVAKQLNAGAVLGAQDLSMADNGAYTGQVSGQMLKELNCQYVLVGHSERRQFCYESSEIVAKKFKQAQKCGLTPILCVGESQAEREQKQTQAVVKAQVQAVIDECGVLALEKSVLAYEPIWAIGTGLTASPEQAQAVHAFLRQFIGESSNKVANTLQILYGGSVNAGNASKLLHQADIDGALVGGASLKAESFLDICKSAL